MAESRDYTHPFTDSNLRFLKSVAIVMVEIPKILQKIMDATMLPSSLYNLIKGNRTFARRLTPADHRVIPTLLSDGYTKLDITLIFKIITHFNRFIPPPTRGWSFMPVPSEITLGDDVQRLRLIRNKVIHRVTLEMTDDELEDFFLEVISICERVDSFLKSTDEESFKRRVESVKIRPLMDLEKVQRLYDENRSTDLLPSAIYRMDKCSRELYERALESGSEIKREIRVLVVGKKEAGKTSLIRRLLSRSLDDVKSTNGIEIHSVLSKDVIDWKLKTQTTDSRLLTGTIQVEKRSSDSEKNNLDRNSSNTGKFESGDEIANVQKAEKELLIDEEFINTEDSESTVSAAEKEDKINQEMIDLTNAEMNDENDIRISIWDFGGDEEFYHTHQIFLAEDVVFLVVTSLVDSAECSQGEFRFWFDTIHSLCKSAEKLNPPCIVIGTHKDKCQSEDDMNKNIETKLDTVEELSRHIHGQVHFISNKEYLAEEIDGIKMAIINAAKENEKWQTMHPLKFILLDKALERKRAESVDKPIVTFNEIKHTNDQLTNPLTDDELDLYLRYNHMLGHLVYYTDIPDYIVINPQWLGNIFRCIVTAEKFKYKLPGQYQDWKKMKNTGQVTDKLLQRIFETIEIDSEHRSYFLEVMKKFHILISRKVSGEEMSQSYFAPCMIRNNELNDLSGLFSGDPDDMSTCLCIECNFLPPFLFNYIIIFLCQQYDCARTTKGLPMFFSNGAIFNISQNMCKKLVVVRFNNIIQLQVLIFGELNSGSHSEIKTLIEQKFNEVIETYSIRIRYEWKWKCPRPTYTNCVGLLTYVEGDQTESYYCDRCGKSHSSRNDWTASLPVTSLTKKQLNFTRLGMLVTEVLADALYDLLPISTQHTKPRNQCDITYLYGEHRRQNIHVPSARHWGGVNKVGDIPSTSLAVGDDIERIRVMRNSLNHSSHYEIDDQEIDTLYKLIHDVLTRFHNLLNSTRTPTYMDRAEEIKQKTMVLSDMKTIEELVKKEPSIIVHHAENINIIHNHYSN